MKKKPPLFLLHLYIGLSVILFFGVQSSKYLELPVSRWIIHYLNDFLAIPIVAFIGLRVVWLVKKNNGIRIKPIPIFLLVVLFAIYFEWYLPQTSSRYTSDIWDVFCYAMGGVVFYGLQKIEN